MGLGSHPAAPRVVAVLAPKLTQYITSSINGGGGGGGGNGKDAGGDISGDCLDILNAMVSGYGTLMTVHHEPLKAALTSLVVVQPPDAIEYIGNYLLEHVKKV